VSAARSHSEDILADFAHQLRQPLSALEALPFCLDLIAKPEDAEVHEQLRRIRAEIAHTDQVLRDGVDTLRVYLLGQGYSALPSVPPNAAQRVAVVRSIKPLNAAT
jgi:signal transduction histidine kinase